MAPLDCGPAMLLHCPACARRGRRLPEGGFVMSRFHPFGPWGEQLQQFQSELNRLFDRWGDGPSSRGFAASYPPVNVWEDAEAVFVEAELPGMNLDDLEIYVTGGNQLTFKGDRKPPVPPRGAWHRQERGHGGFVRVLTLPTAVNPDKVDARFEHGVLLVKLAKHEAAKPRKINVKVQ
jgi:HSP20 family protein